VRARRNTERAPSGQSVALAQRSNCPASTPESARLTRRLAPGYVACVNAGSIRRTLAVVALIAAFGACSGGDDDAAGDGVASDGADNEDAVDYSADHDGEDSVVPGNAELEAALLRVDDLPDGLIDLDLHYSGVEICGMRTEMPESFEDDQFPAGAAAFALHDDSIVPDVFEKIVVVPAGTGAQVFQRARGLLDICNSGGEVDGLASLSATEVAVPTLGDESVAKRVTIEELASGTTVGINVLYARAGDTIVAVGVVEPDGETDRLVELATIAFDRATAA
jgi:hypothetical protein